MSHARESHYATQVCRYFLVPIGIYPISGEFSPFLKFLSESAILACYLLILFLLVPCALHVFLEEPNPRTRLKLIGPMSFHLMVLIKYLSLVGLRKDIEECLEIVEEDWKSTDRRDAKVELQEMRKKARLGRFLADLCAAFMYGGGFFYHLVMPLTSTGGADAAASLERLNGATIRNRSNHSATAVSRVLAYPVYARLMKVDRSPIYKIVFLVQTASGYVLYTITIGACSLAAVFVSHVCSQLEIVMTLLRDLARSEENGGSFERVAVEKDIELMPVIVERHLRALNFAARVEKSLKVICFVELVGCTANICFIGYYAASEWQSRNAISTVTYAILLVSFSFNIFIFCYIGELLTEQCKRVGEAAYDVNWYDVPSERARNLIIVILIAGHRPAKLTAAGMIHLSMENFSNVVMSAAAYLNLLITAMM